MAPWRLRVPSMIDVASTLLTPNRIHPIARLRPKERALSTSCLSSRCLLHGLPRASCRRCLLDECSKLVLPQLTRCCKCVSMRFASVYAKARLDRLSIACRSSQHVLVKVLWPHPGANHEALAVAPRRALFSFYINFRRPVDSLACLHTATDTLAHFTSVHHHLQTCKATYGCVRGVITTKKRL